ncbi:LysR family transcriptional regulator [Mesorhizobium sp. 131-2-1]|uniref:LysR family transcriptional regulator n=1 Tax=Mesorhizobium sp. 131-2-1 TaxID=2744518 RepID=UPI0018EC9552|nr:LysR family transcriptional regulator [Mesorhizobium sp. 131-2-1]BCG97905.1 LysR family transcriptional regulator [Mesorhizobium sp. 131-2-1]
MDPEAGLELTHSFVIVAEELSFRRSAERLNLDQSALTRRIQKLEHILGFALFERTTREVSLTPAGRSFYEENAQLLQNYSRSVKAAKLVAEGKTGVLRLAYMAFAATELMPHAVSRFRRLYPHVDVNLRYIRTQGQKLALAHDEVDIGYMIGPFDHSDFHSLLLTADPLYVVTPRNHRFTRLHEVRPADLAEEELILGDMIEWEAYRWRLNDMFSGEGVPLNIKLEASNTLALLGLVAAGLGVTVYPESLIGFLGRNVEVRPIIHPDFRIQTVLVWKRANRAKAVRHFVEVAKNLPARG